MQFVLLQQDKLVHDLYRYLVPPFVLFQEQLLVLMRFLALLLRLLDRVVQQRVVAVDVDHLEERGRAGRVGKVGRRPHRCARGGVELGDVASAVRPLRLPPDHGHLGVGDRDDGVGGVGAAAGLPTGAGPARGRPRPRRGPVPVGGPAGIRSPDTQVLWCGSSAAGSSSGSSLSGASSFLPFGW